MGSGKPLLHNRMRAVRSYLFYIIRVAIV